MYKLKIKLYNILPQKIQLIWGRIENSDIGSRIASGAFWSLLGSIISQGLMLVATIVVARILGKVEFGELGIIRSTINMFAVFAGFGLGMTATKYVAELYLKDKLRTGKIIGLSTLFAGSIGFIIATILVFLAPFIATKTINAPHLVNEIRLSAIMLYFSAMNGSQTGILAGFEAFKTIAKVNLIAGFFAFPIQIAFTWYFGLQGSVIGFGLNFVFLWFLNLIAVRKESRKNGINISYRESLNEWTILYKFSFPAVMSGFLVSPIMWLCTAMLVNTKNGYAEMAVFDAANQWRNATLFIPAILSQIALPLFSSTVGDDKLFNRILKLNIMLVFMISFSIAIIISLLAKFIMGFYGNDFISGSNVLIILTFTTVLISVNNIIGQAIAGKGKMWNGFVLNLIWGIILLTSSYIFLKNKFGAKGLAYALLISYLTHTLLQFLYLKRFILKSKNQY